jgi:hypothetical protein
MMLALESGRTPDTPTDPLTQTSFFCCLNDNWGTLLKWTCDDHINNLVFLDQCISITTMHQIHFKMFQKEHNLYLYIPPGSAHPKNMLFGSGPPDCRLQNTSTDGFIKMAILLV